MGDRGELGDLSSGLPAGRTHRPAMVNHLDHGYTLPPTVLAAGAVARTSPTRSRLVYRDGWLPPRAVWVSAAASDPLGCGIQGCA